MLLIYLTGKTVEDYHLKYINTDILLINGIKIHRDNITDRFIDCAIINQDHIKQDDQDMINAVLSDQIASVSDECNAPLFNETRVRERKFNTLSNSFILYYLSEEKSWIPEFNLPWAEKYSVY